MTALRTALEVIFPTFFMIGVGALADRLLPELSMETLARLSVYLLIPALVFGAISETQLGLEAALLIAAAYLLYLLVLGLVAALGSAGLTVAQTRGVVVTSLFGNTGNMGLPITLFAYGAAGFERAVVIFVVSLVVMFAVGPTVLAGGGSSFTDRFKEALRLPPIWAALAGLGVNVTQLGLPESLTQGVSLLGSAAIPVMLLSLGIQMRRSWVWAVGRAAVRSFGLRLLVGPFIAYGVGRFLGLEALDLKVLVLSAVMPAAVTMFVIAVEVRGDYEGVARSVIATTVGSFVAITAVIFLLPA